MSMDAIMYSILPSEDFFRAIADYKDKRRIVNLKMMKLKTKILN